MPFPSIVYEGVFRTFSTDLDIVLDQCHQVDPEDPTKIDPATVKVTGVFNMKRIIRCSAFDVDLNHAKDGFMTDTQITGTGRLNGERTLEEWIPDMDEEQGVSLELEENDANGWRAEDMFKGTYIIFYFSFFVKSFFHEKNREIITNFILLRKKLFDKVNW